MPKAEVGSIKHLGNKMKAKGLQRLRWWCQICGKQCRDENGFKQHTLSEGHVRAMLLVGEDPKKYIEDYSRQFKRDFLQLLKMSHGEKKVYINQFYQEYIRDKEHVHMNATKWPSLTEFAKFLGREGICRVEEGERGLEVAFVDDSPEAVSRREDVRRKERLVKGDEALEARMLERQVRLAREEAERAGRSEGGGGEGRERVGEVETEPVKVSLSLGGSKAVAKRDEQPKELVDNAPMEISTFSTTDKPAQPENSETLETADDDEAEDTTNAPAQAKAEPAAPVKMSFSLGAKPKASNPLMQKSNPLSKKKKDRTAIQPEKKMSNAERIMREEIERKRKAEERFGPGAKRQRM